MSGGPHLQSASSLLIFVLFTLVLEVESCSAAQVGIKILASNDFHLSPFSAGAWLVGELFKH